MMTDKKTLGGLTEASSKPEAMEDLIQQARKLRDTLDDFISETREPPGLQSILRFSTTHLENMHFLERFRGTAMEEGVVCGHIICPQLASVDPSVWSRLPEELLEHVFAMLPAADICRLQCLSKRWQQKMTGRSHFKIACAERNAPIIALVHDSLKTSDKFKVALYDVNANKWYFSKLDIRDSVEHYQTPSATDGSLVCFISAYEATEEKPMQIVVCNPLTSDRRRLEREGMKTYQVKMLQITTNRNTGHYKVLLGAQTGRSFLHCSVEIFDSQTNNWTRLEQLGNDAPPGDLFFGMMYNWELDDLNRCPEIMGPCVVNCTNGKMDELDDGSRPFARTFVNEYALVRDRLFVLYVKEEEGEANQDNAAYGQVSTMEGQYCFTEYKMQTTYLHFVELKTVKCSHSQFPCGHDYDITMWTLCACEGFVLLVAHESETFHSSRGAIAFLYDLTTEEWRVLPFVPLPLRFHHDDYDHLLCLMCWDACSTL